jgi:hypothetical protein
MLSVVGVVAFNAIGVLYVRSVHPVIIDLWMWVDFCAIAVVMVSHTEFGFGKLW